MTREDRKIRSAAGMLAVGLAGAGLGRVEDDRSQRNRRWGVNNLARAIVVGLAVGLSSFKALESLTDRLSRPLRGKLGIGRRISDTTLRDFAVHARFDSLVAAMHRQVRTARRRKQLDPVGLPCNMTVIDGKVVTTPFDGATKERPEPNAYAQEQSAGRYAVRTMTCALVSGRATVCIHASPVPRETNEMGHFIPTLRELAQAYGRGSFLELISADAGMTSLENANFIHYELGSIYLLALKGTQRELLDEAERHLRHLGPHQAQATTRELIGGKVHTRYLWTTAEMAGYHGWTHLDAVLRVRWEVTEADGTVVSTMDRYFLSNASFRRFTSSQWLAIVRAHWQVENDIHRTLDISFNEDDRPWSRDPTAMLALQVFRRIALNALALFRAHSLREERPGLIPWRELMERLLHALHAATAIHIADLRWAEIPDVTTRA